VWIGLCRSTKHTRTLRKLRACVWSGRGLCEWGVFCGRLSCGDTDKLFWWMRRSPEKHRTLWKLRSKMPIPAALRKGAMPLSDRSRSLWGRWLCGSTSRSASLWGMWVGLCSRSGVCGWSLCGVVSCGDTDKLFRWLRGFASERLALWCVWPTLRAFVAMQRRQVLRSRTKLVWWGMCGSAQRSVALWGVWERMCGRRGL